MQQWVKNFFARSNPILKRVLELGKWLFEAFKSVLQSARKATLSFIYLSLQLLLNPGVWVTGLILAFFITIVDLNYRQVGPTEVGPKSTMKETELRQIQNRTMHDFAFTLIEVHHELNPNSIARSSHIRGIAFGETRAKARYAMVSVNTPDDPRPALRRALEVLKLEESDRNAIYKAMIILEGYFSTYAGRESISFDFAVEKLSGAEKLVIDNAISDFIRYVEENISDGPLGQSEKSRRDCVEVSCDYGRRISYVLFPYWNEYQQVATQSDLARLEKLKALLKEELAYTKKLFDATSDNHVADVVISVERRLEILSALEIGDRKVLKKIILDALETSQWSPSAHKEVL